MVEQEVEFICDPDKLGDIPEPKASSNVFPEWYKNLSPRYRDKFSQETVRLCPAFLDALSLGWIIPFEEDIKVNSETPETPPVDYIGPAEPNEVGSGELPEGAIDCVTFKSSWAMNVPDDYSVLIVDPMNRRDTRFHVIGEYRDADKNTNTLDVTAFWYADNAKTYIEAGEPMAQVVPMKRGSRIDYAEAKPFGDVGFKAYDRTKSTSSISKSYYRENIWIPKGTRVVK